MTGKTVVRQDGTNSGFEELPSIGCLVGTQSRSNHHQGTRKKEAQAYLETHMAILHSFVKFMSLRKTLSEHESDGQCNRRIG